MRFELDVKQMKKVEAFYEEHKDDIGTMGAIGGGVTYCFTPTSIGVFCSVTMFKGMPQEVSLDLNDYDEF